MTPTASASREQLNRILASKTFRNADRLSKLLAYLVDAALAQTNEPLKEYSIALDVFDRPASFDPHSESVVRIAARQLRFKLRDYYDTEGRADPVRIDLPKGRYVPEFVAVEALAQSRWPWRWWRWAAAALAILSVAGATVYLVKRLRPAPITTVAVLPFDNLSAAPEDAYVCQGFVDELTTALANVETLRVVARTSAARLKESADLGAEARQARVSAVVEGSMRKTGEQYRITAQLISTADGYHRWSRTFVEDVGGIPAVTDAVARGIAETLRPGSKAPPHTTESSDLEARRLYWKGRYLRRQRGAEAVSQAVEAFRGAVQRDPRFAAGWTALAEACNTAAFHQLDGFAAGEAARQARDAARRALELDGAQAGAYGTLAAVSFFNDWDWPAAEGNFRRALALNPSDAKDRYWYALGLLSQGRVDEALTQARQARDLDPLSFTVSNDLAVVLYCARRYDEAMRLAREALATDATYFPAHALLGCCYAARKAYGEASREFEQALRGSDRYSYLVGRLGHAYALAGRTAEARKLLDELLQRGDAPTLSYVHVAYIYAGLGQTQPTLAALEKAFQRRDGDTSFLAVEPLFDGLRREPRFRALVARLRGGR